MLVPIRPEVTYLHKRRGQWLQVTGKDRHLPHGQWGSRYCFSPSEFNRDEGSMRSVGVHAGRLNALVGPDSWPLVPYEGV